MTAPEQAPHELITGQPAPWSSKPLGSLQAGDTVITSRLDTKGRWIYEEARLRKIHRYRCEGGLCSMTVQAGNKLTSDHRVRIQTGPEGQEAKWSDGWLEAQEMPDTSTRVYAQDSVINIIVDSPHGILVKDRLGRHFLASTLSTPHNDGRQIGQEPYEILLGNGYLARALSSPTDLGADHRLWEAEDHTFPFTGPRDGTEELMRDRHTVSRDLLLGHFKSRIEELLHEQQVEIRALLHEQREDMRSFRATELAEINLFTRNSNPQAISASDREGQEHQDLIRSLRGELSAGEDRWRNFKHYLRRLTDEQGDKTDWPENLQAFRLTALEEMARAERDPEQNSSQQSTGVTADLEDAFCAGPGTLCFDGNVKICVADTNPWAPPPEMKGIDWTVNQPPPWQAVALSSLRVGAKIISYH